jgi:hypothetical protein
MENDNIVQVLSSREFRFQGACAALDVAWLVVKYKTIEEYVRKAACRCGEDENPSFPP